MVTQKQERSDQKFVSLTSVLEICEKRADDLAQVVKVRAVYHNKCSQYFRFGKPLPKEFAEVTPQSARKRGRPIDHDKDLVFEEVVSCLQGNDDDQITINDLVVLMKNKSEDTSDQWRIKTMRGPRPQIFWGPNSL